MNYTSFETDCTANAHCGLAGGHGFGGHVALPHGFVILKITSFMRAILRRAATYCLFRLQTFHHDQLRCAFLPNMGSCNLFHALPQERVCGKVEWLAAPRRSAHMEAILGARNLLGDLDQCETGVQDVPDGVGWVD
jgi:hypothetical protein